MAPSFSKSSVWAVHEPYTILRTASSLKRRAEPSVADADVAVRATIRSQLHSWEFDVFAVAALAGGKPLAAVVTELLEAEGLLDGWLLDRPTVARFLEAAEAAYNANAYHSSVHAADVAQTAGVLLRAIQAHLASAPGGARPLSKIEVFAVIIAAAVHDLGHLGFTNDFLVKSRHELALTYNDRSVNEANHVASAFRLAAGGAGCDIFARFSAADYSEARGLIVDMVLGTDMAVHHAALAAFEASLAACPDVRLWGGKDRALMLKIALHVADLSNPARPWALAAAWGERIVAESLAQGEAEAARGMAVTPNCDRRSVNLPGAQLGFVGLFAEPTLAAFAAAAPSFAAMAMPHLAEVRVRWAFFEEAGVRAPCQGAYPPLSAAALAQVEEARQQATAAHTAAMEQQQATIAEWRQRQQA